MDTLAVQYKSKQPQNRSNVLNMDKSQIFSYTSQILLELHKISDSICDMIKNLLPQLFTFFMLFNSVFFCNALRTIEK